MVCMVCGYFPYLETLDVNDCKTDLSSNGTLGVSVDKPQCGDFGKTSDNTPSTFTAGG